MNDFVDVTRADGTLFWVERDEARFYPRFRFYYRHIPSGTEHTDKYHFENRRAFARCLVRWSEQQPGVWVYRDTP